MVGSLMVCTLTALEKSEETKKELKVFFKTQHNPALLALLP